MAFSPRDVDAMSMWQFHACLDGWNAAHGGKENKEMTDAEFDAAARAYDAFPDQTT